MCTIKGLHNYIFTCLPRNSTYIFTAFEKVPYIPEYVSIDFGKGQSKQNGWGETLSELNGTQVGHRRAKCSGVICCSLRGRGALFVGGVIILYEKGASGCGRTDGRTDENACRFQSFGQRRKSTGRQKRKYSIPPSTARLTGPHHT